ncbi:hypothetical protein L596_010076 [Steinernema carpocapsae]|uniref:Uncharacterized protein n=1 Tax=Steinernema carpocapsae TaxID=34508 RepID=A0A4U5PH87_STECR|nr:hypothetical protein L596_010076 [Steinernema carpocapsae]
MATLRQPHASDSKDACGKTAEDAGRMRLELWGGLNKSRRTPQPQILVATLAAAATARKNAIGAAETRGQGPPTKTEALGSPQPKTAKKHNQNKQQGRF